MHSPRLAGKPTLKRGAAAKAEAAFAEQLASSPPTRKNTTSPGAAATGAESDRSDLSSLSSLSECEGDGDEGPESVYRGKGESPGPGGDDSSDDDQGGPFTPRKSVQKAYFVQPGPVPSKIGIGIARPVHAAGMKTYSGRRRAPRLDAKLPRTPRASTSSHLLDADASPLTPLSALTRKRRASASAPRPSSSPSKRKGLSNEEMNDDYPLSGRPHSRRRMTVNGLTSDILPGNGKPSSTSSKGKHAQRTQSDASVPSSSQRLRKDSVLAKPDVWTLDSLGKLAWVRVDLTNALTEDLLKEAFWWPAEIEYDNGPAKSVRATLYFPPAPKSPDFLQLEISKPSPAVVLSQVDPQRRERFTVNNFHYLPHADPLLPRIQTEDSNRVESRWKKACEAMLSADMDMNDGLPSSLAGLLSQVPKESPVRGNKGSGRKALVGTRDKGKARQDSLTSDLSEKENSPPPPPDAHVQVPGELVLAKEKRTHHIFWPAVVIGYAPPNSPKAHARYLVKFLDGTELDITRDMFYIYEQEEFGTCQLGKFASAEPLHGKDGDDDGNQGETPSKPPSPLFIPESRIPAPSSEEFTRLPILGQLAYILPVLENVLKNTYKPAEQRNSQFLRGGRQRGMLLENAPPKGSLTRHEYNELARIVKYWALGSGSPSNGIRTEDCSHASGDPDLVDEVNHPSPSLIPGENQKAASCHDDPMDEIVIGPASGSNESITTHVRIDVDDISSNTKQAPDIETEECPSLPPSSLPPSSLPLPRLSSLPPSSLPTSVTEGSPNNTLKLDIDDNTGTIDDNILTESVQATTATSTNISRRSTTPSFNDLSEHEKIHYCTDVLLGEAIIQILLWRSGKRSDPRPLTATEEERLHEIGSIMANDFDFVHSILTLREKKVKSIKAKQPLKAQNSLRGTRSRPKNG
ncbi:hypothetical protein M0805_002713 [Coniferiporia weirii]|nr:hypothetical protein M0805_002713 [Coniferiporia weirii]